MIKRLLLTFTCMTLSLVSGIAAADGNAIVTPSVDLRLFVGEPGLAGVFEADYRKELGNRHYRSFRAGMTGISLIAPDWALRWGVSLWREYGALVESDWLKIDDQWQWAPGNDRALDSLSVDLAPRARLSSALIGELRIRYQHGLGDPRRSFRIRPGAQWSLRRAGAPFLENFIHVEAYFSQVERASNPYEVWTYVSTLWHAWRGALIGPKIAFGGNSFGVDGDAGPYEISNSIWSVGLVGVFHLR